MKKYFSLFTVSFMVLEACLIAGSSLSYAMEPEFDESGQSIVISNSQRQKIRKVSLHQEDPAADLRLNPFRGETLWFEKKKVEFSYVYFNKKYELQYPEPIEITLSPIARSEDCRIVLDGLGAYNQEKIEIYSSIFLTTPYTKDAVAEMFQESLLLDFDDLLSQIGLNKTQELLAPVEMSAYAKGARRAYTVITTDLTPLFLAAQWSKNLISNGYTLSGTVPSLTEKKHEQHFYKELEEVKIENNNAFDLQWVSDSDSELDDEGASELTDKFGFFVRKNGDIKGGLLGVIYNESFIPYTDIDVLWIDSTIREAGLGTKLMNFALNHSKEHGARIAQLGTDDFQAPGFYEKQGFKKIVTDPNIRRTLDGKLSNSYLYRKEL